MAIDSTHPHYVARLTEWQRCRDCYTGGDAVRARGATYLPMLSGQDSTEYAAYAARALFYNAFARTVSALTGVLFRRPSPPVAPASMSDHWADVTLGGQSLDLFALGAAADVFTVGRAGLMVDVMPGSTNGRPYWVSYAAENIIGWQGVRGPDGVPRPTRVVLKECTIDQAGDAYEVAESIRVLYMDGPRYAVQKYKHPRKADGSFDTTKWEADGGPVYPMRRGAAMSFIPFTFVNAASLLPDPARPPLLDLADVNLSHYRTSADLEHGRHFTALPTPYVTGYDGRGGALTIGSQKAWTIGSAEATVGMLEFSGAGLASLERALEQKERHMAVLGARMLESQKSGVEAEGTVRMRHAGDDATLRVVATTLGAAISRLMRWHVWWDGATKEPDDASIAYDLGVEFFSVRMTSADLAALVAAYQAGTMSFDTFYYNLQRGDVARPEVTAKQERHAIDAEDADGEDDPADATEVDDAEVDDDGDPGDEPADAPPPPKLGDNGRAAKEPPPDARSKKRPAIRQR